MQRIIKYNGEFLWSYPSSYWWIKYLWYFPKCYHKWQEQLQTRVTTIFYFNWPVFNQKNYETCKEIKKCDPESGEKSSQSICLWVFPDVECSKDFKAAIISMLNELKGIIFKELNDTVTTSQQIENFNKDIKII